MGKLKSIKNNILFLYHAIRLLLIPNRSLLSLLYIGNRLSESKVGEQAAKELLKNERIEQQAMIRYGFSSLKLEALQPLKEKSFGRVLYDFMTEQQLDVYPLQENTEASASVYLRERRRKIHDFLHVVLEYGTDLHGEAEVNAFTARQTGMPICYLIIIGVMLKTMLKQPLEFHKLMDRLRMAWKRGGQAENLFIFPWEDMLTLPLIEVREILFQNKQILSTLDLK